jgi:uncharacterized protein YgbK (DUF1537 family)
MTPLPESGPILTYYGDDFTGSTDALEALSLNGVETVLFLDTPGERALEAFPNVRAVGMAGESRSRPPAWMSQHLPPIFTRLKQFGAPICQYKVCSTFDSSPHTGNIGRAAEIGQDVFEAPYVPVVVAAPHLRRYVLFSNLFAASAGVTYRIDRHPVMRCHPVTPMHEADLRVHLAAQTNRKIGSVDLPALRSGDVRTDADLLVFDGLDEESLRETGRMLWNAPPRFAVGSSGLTYALMWFWRSAGWLPPAPALAKAQPVDRLIVLSGSCSPVSERQIRYAASHGFAQIPLDPAGLVAQNEAIANAALETALNELAAGRSVVLYSALGPAGVDSSIPRDQLSTAMGRLLRELLLRSGATRAVIAGGDTSTHACSQLGLTALTFVAPLQPGAPICKGHADPGGLGGVELILKGGQVGTDAFFETALTGK